VVLQDRLTYLQGICRTGFGPGWKRNNGSSIGGIAGVERAAQTEVRQDGADYNSCLGKRKFYFSIVRPASVPGFNRRLTCAVSN
jgi:hypothetical protein